jgi:hypothetical protein
MLLWIHILSIFLVLSFALFYSLNLIMTPKTSIFIKVFSILVLLSVLYVGVNRNTYLPFLGYTAMPPSLFIESSPKNATNEAIIRVEAPDGSKVVYWAAMSTGDEYKNPFAAYGDYSNSGVAIVVNKRALLRFNCPDRYNIGSIGSTGNIIDKHVHYRIIETGNAIMSPVYTKFVGCREASH